MEIDDFFLQFSLPDSIKNVPEQERTRVLREHFRNCMQKIQPFLTDIQVVSEFENVLSATLQGSVLGITRLAFFLKKQRLGTVISNNYVARAAAEGQPVEHLSHD